jgi:hypothetical protein
MSPAIMVATFCTLLLTLPLVAVGAVWYQFTKHSPARTHPTHVHHGFSERELAYLHFMRWLQSRSSSAHRRPGDVSVSSTRRRFPAA